MQQGIFVAIPAYGGLMYHGCVLSIIKLERACRARNLAIEYQFTANESLIPRARNSLTQIFMQTNLSHILFIDADIEFDPEDILRMLDANVDVIGGVYPKKNVIRKGNLQTDYALTLLPNIEITPQQPLLVKYVGTGMLMIQRHVLNNMIAHGLPSYKIGETRYYAFFNTCIDEEETYLSEDYYFCEAWRRLGGSVYAALWTLDKCIHWGTYGYRHNM